MAVVKKLTIFLVVAIFGLAEGNWKAISQMTKISDNQVFAICYE